MSRCKRMRAGGLLSPVARGLVIAFTVSAASCSADVTRFGLGTNSTTSSIPVPTEPMGRGYGASERGWGANEPSRGTSLTETTLPPSSPPANYQVVGRTYSQPPAAEPLPMARWEPTARQPLNPPASGAETIEVQQGDTLYNIARRHGVAVAAIKDLNGLQSEAVRPGQRLALPAAGGQDRAPAAKAPPAWTDRAVMAKHTPPAADPPPAGWEGRYTMRNGDSLYGIALQHRVTLDELKRANGITDPTRVWAGTVLAVPGRTEPSAERTPPPNTPPRVVQTPPRVINAAPDQPSAAPDQPQKMAKRSDVMTDAPPQTEVTAGRFRWPVRGRVIVGFGERPDGTKNDGINLAVPQGTDIHAAEAGRVAYAGNELKGYGNLILIRHPNGWVSAYAHADQILVRSNDDVKRGQIIAKAGKTGSVDQPQLHFELRQGSRPVDPLPHLAN